MLWTALHEKSSSLESRVLAPEEQHVYSFSFISIPLRQERHVKTERPEAHGAPLERPVISGLRL